MKKILGPILLFAFLLPLSGFSQKKDRQRKKLEKKALEYYDRVFGDDHAMFSVTKVPDEFKDESKVIIGQQVHLALLRNTSTNGNSTKVALRKRVYLNDEAAVNDFSEFYYQNSDVIGITIIKPDGTETEIDLTDAVKVTTEVPKFYQDKFHSGDYFKKAIPGLKIGDIVDYFKVFSESYQRYIELVIPVGSEAPILEQEIIFDVDKLWSSFYKSFNGAPKISLAPEGGFDMKGRKRKSVKRLIFNAKNTPVYDDNRWSHDLLHTPLIKFMALPPGTEIGKKKQVSNNLDEKELFETILKQSLLYLDFIKRDPQSRIKAMKLIDEEIEPAANVIYRILRTEVLRVMDNPEQSVTDFSYHLSRNTRELPDGIFSTLFAELLDYADIESDIVMIMPKSRGDLSNAILFSEPTVGVYIPSIKKYYWPVNNFSLPGETPSYLQGSKGIKVKYALAQKRKKTFSSCSVPTSTIEDNKMIVNIAAQVDADNLLTLENEMHLSGYYREYYSSLFLYNYNYLDEEFEITKSYQTVKEIKKDAKKSRKPKKSKKSKKKKKSKDYTFFVEGDDKDYSKVKKEMLENWLKLDYEVTTHGKTEVLNTGMGAENNILKVKYDFTTDSYVNKAGPNLVFNIGKLIGEQVQLTEEEIAERTIDINYSTPRSIEYNISITIPEGKTANGLEGLNMSVVNEIGEFVSSAEQVGNLINVKTVKKYKNNNFSASEWSKMVDYLEAGFQFTEKKVILK